MNDGTKTGFLRSGRLIAGLLIVLVVAIVLYLSTRDSVSESSTTLVNEPSAVTIQSAPSKPSASELEKQSIAPFEGMSADASSTLRDLLDKEYCYSRNGEAVMENPNASMSQEKFDKDATEAINRMMRLADSLRLSTDGDHLFASAILSQWGGGRYESFENANAADPGNRIYRFYHATQCMRKNANCDMAQVLDELVRVDTDNTQAFLLRAMHRYSANSLDLALNDLQHAATLSRTEDYFADLVFIMERAFAATGMGFSESANGAFGIAASMSIPYHQLSQMCTKMSESNEAWRVSCTDFLERSEAQASTELAYAISLGTLNAIVQAAPEGVKRKNEIASRYAAYRKQRRARTRKALGSDFGNEFYLFESPRVFNDYLNHMKAHGERSAQQYYEEEVKRLKANGWLSPCELKRRIEASAE